MRPNESSATDVRVTWLRHRLYARGSSYLERARAHAVEVEATSRREKWPDTHGYRGTPAESLENRVGAYQAEIAVSLYTGLPWNPDVGGFGRPDVGDDVEVKCRERKYSTYLVIAEGHARRDRRYVIAYGRDPELYLAGWCYGEHVLELPVKVFAANQSPGYAAPAEWLLAMDTFPEVVRVVRDSPRQSRTTRGRRQKGTT